MFFFWMGIVVKLSSKDSFIMFFLSDMSSDTLHLKHQVLLGVWMRLQRLLNIITMNTETRLLTGLFLWADSSCKQF